MLSLKLKFAILVSLLSFSSDSVNAQKNITVDNSDPSIQYSGQSVRNVPVCKVDQNGLVISGQPGCYNAPSMCTTSAATSQVADAAAEFKFKGSAIYITGFLDFLSPIYTVTLDGVSSDADGARPSGPFICSPLFSSSNLDPNVEHTVHLSIKGASPNRNTTIDPQGTEFNFGLVNFIYTVSDNVAVSNSTALASSAPSSSTSLSSTATSASAASNPSSSSSRASRQTINEASFASMILRSTILIAVAGLV